MTQGAGTGRSRESPDCCLTPAVPGGVVPNSSRVLEYVADRRCSLGGYCFYRLDEPNAADTCRALVILDTLGALSPDPETTAFLRGLQEPGGSFSSLAAGYAAILGLSLLGEAPVYDSVPWIRSSFRTPDPGREVMEVLSPFEQAHTWVALCRLLQAEPTEEESGRIERALRSHQHPEGGFGTGRAGLLDTWHATRTLRLLGRERYRENTLAFIKRCSDPEYGFLNAPGVRPPYLEHLHAGILLSRELGTAPVFREACIAFLDRCAHRSGGFVRSVFGGSPTLEFTGYAVTMYAALAGGAPLPGTDL
jgi:hypothetical protein